MCGVLAVVAVSAAGLVGVTVRAAGAPAGGLGAPPVRVLAVGDSLVKGHRVPGGWRAPLWGLLERTGHPHDMVGTRRDGPAGTDPDHEGHPGWTTVDLDGHLGGILAVTAPEVVVLEIGTNDLWYRWDVPGEPSAPPGDVAGRISTLVERILGAGVRGVVVVGPGPADHPRLGPPGRIGLVTAGLRRRWGADPRVRIVDPRERIDVVAGGLDPDGIHHGPAGAVVLADGIFDAVVSLEDLTTPTDGPRVTGAATVDDDGWVTLGPGGRADWMLPGTTPQMVVRTTGGGRVGIRLGGVRVAVTAPGDRTVTVGTAGARILALEGIAGTTRVRVDPGGDRTGSGGFR